MRIRFALLTKTKAFMVDLFSYYSLKICAFGFAPWLFTAAGVGYQAYRRKLRKPVPFFFAGLMTSSLLIWRVSGNFEDQIIAKYNIEEIIHDPALIQTLQTRVDLLTAVIDLKENKLADK